LSRQKRCEPYEVAPSLEFKERSKILSSFHTLAYED
jgi:hypothetical protein